MTIFDELPVIPKCCFCVNLRLGSIIIAIWGIIYGTTHISMFIIPKMCKTNDGLFTMFLRIATYLCTVATLLFLLSCIIFLIGICIHKRVTAVLFLYCTVLILLTDLVFYIACILVTVFETNCEVKMFLISVLIEFFLWMHFLLVVRSYKDEME